MRLHVVRYLIGGALSSASSNSRYRGCKLIFTVGGKGNLKKHIGRCYLVFIHPTRVTRRSLEASLSYGITHVSGFARDRHGAHSFFGLVWYFTFCRCRSCYGFKSACTTIL